MISMKILLRNVKRKFADRKMGNYANKKNLKSGEKSGLLSSIFIL